MIDNKHIGSSGKYNMFSRGMVQDSSENRQPEETYRYGLNGVKGTLEGDRTNRANEPGSKVCWAMPEGFFKLSDVYMSSGFTAILAVNPSTGESLIGKGYDDCRFESVVLSKCLGFDLKYQIQAIGRIRIGCEDTVYWTDAHEEVRYFNFDSPSNFYTEEYIQFLNEGNTPSQYDGEKWDCTKFGLFREFSIGCISDARVIVGGSLKSGSMNFALRWLDEDFNPTPWFPTTNTINIYREFTNTAENYPAVQGSSNVETDVNGGTASSNKSVELTISNKDIRFSYYQIAVIHAYSFTGNITEVMVSPPVPIEQERFVVDGNFSTYTVGDLAELRLGAVDIKRAKTIAQLENRLVLGGVEGRKYDVCGFQKYASKICTQYVVKSVDIDDINSVGDVKNPNTMWLYGSHQGDEVAANAIVYVFKDGSHTPAYHIPGPPPNRVPCVGTNSIKQTLEYTCIYVSPAFEGPLEGEVGEVKVEIKYTIGGVQKEAVFWITSEDVELECFLGDVEWSVDQVTAYPLGIPQNIIPVAFTMKKYVEVDVELDTECAFVTKNGQFHDSDNGLSEGWDTEIIQTWSDKISPLVPQKDENNVPYELWGEERKVQRWEVENTAIPFTNGRGRPAFYQCKNSVYPDIRDCDGNPIWGTDSCGNPLVGTPIRHPRLPNRSIEPIIEGAENIGYENVLTLQVFVDGPYKVIIYYKEGNQNKNIQIEGSYSGKRDIVASSQELTLINKVVIGNFPPNAFVKVATEKRPVQGQSTRRARILGFEFSNIEYPHPDIVGHYFVTAIRDDVNKTVSDAGIINPTKEGEGNYGFAYFSRFLSSASGNRNIPYYLTPEFLNLGKETSGEQIQYQGKYLLGGKELRCTDLDGAGSVFKNVDTIIDVRRQSYSNYSPVTESPSSIREVVNLGALGYKENYFLSGDLVNTSITNRAQILNIKTAMPQHEEDSIFYAYSRRFRDVYCDLFGIVYRPMHNCMLKLEDEQVVFGGDTYITPFSINNTLLREIYDSFWDDLLKAAALVFTTGLSLATLGIVAPAALAATTLILTGATVALGIGLTAIAIQAYKERFFKRRYNRIVKDAELRKGCSQDFLEDSFIAYASERIEGIYVESQIPFALRQEYVGDCGSLFKGGDILEYFKSKIVELNPETNKYQPKALICPELYWINPDFSRTNKEYVFLPIPITFKCCSKCLEEHRNRFTWSQQSFQEERVDNYRVFLPNDYKDIDAQHGEINNAIPYHERLLILTEDGLWVSVASLQERVAGDIVTYLGTGQFLGVPERKAIDDEIGAVGCQHQWGALKTRFGVFIADEKESSLYLYGNGIKDVFVGRMKAWAQENFQPFLKKYLEGMGIHDFDKFDNPANPNGIGIHMVYDPFFRRVLMTKRDYEPHHMKLWNLTRSDPFNLTLQQLLNAGAVTGELYYYNGRFFEFTGSSLKEVPFTHRGYFRDRSFTLSYYPEDDEFGFFHSYLPLSYARDKTTFYAFQDHVAWKHNQDNMLSFFGKKYPFIVEGVDVADGATDKYTDYIAFYTQAKKKVDKGYADANTRTFGKVVLYNSYQTTGVLNMTVSDEENLLPQSVSEDTNTVFVERRGKDFYINDVWNATQGQEDSLFRKDWPAIAQHYPIDKVPNFDIQNSIGEWQGLTPMFDKYIAYRFYFEGDEVLILHYVVPGSYKTQF